MYADWYWSSCWFITRSEHIKWLLVGVIDGLNALVLALLYLVQIVVLSLVKDSHRLTVAFCGLQRCLTSLLIFCFLELWGKFRFFSLAVDRGVGHLIIALINLALLEAIAVLFLKILIGWRHSLIWVKIERVLIIHVVRHKRCLLRAWVIHCHSAILVFNRLEVGLVNALAAHWIFASRA